jgi:hypothetical protein
VEWIHWRKAKESTFANRVSLRKNNNNNNNNNSKGGQLLAGLRLHISVALQQKTANFKVAIESRQMQWSALTEEKQNNQLAQTEFRFINTIIKTIIIIKGRAITRSHSPSHQRCTAAKDGKLQGGLRQQTNAAEWLDWEQRKNQLAPTEFRFIKTIIM